MTEHTDYRQIHTTIHKKYWQYAKDKKIPWNELLTQAIEQKMKNDPDILKQKLEQNIQENQQIQKELQQAQQNQQIDEKKKALLSDIHKGLIPVA